MNLKKSAEEKTEEYIYRICSHKDEIGTWQDVANVINKELGAKCTESAYRKAFQYYDKYYNTVGIKNIEDQKVIDDMVSIKEDIIRERVRLQDRTREYRKTLRDEARIQDLETAVKDYVKIQPKLNFDAPKISGTQKNEAILMLSDWHIGDQFKNFYGEYNIDIAQKRISDLTVQTIHYCKLNQVKTIHVMNLGDLISGIIHVNGRITQECDVIEQVKQASEIMSQVLCELSKNFNVVYHSVIDNHSRVFPNKEENIAKENFNKLIDWYVKERVKGNGILFDENNPDPSFCAFHLQNGKEIVGTHGNFDNGANSVIQNYTLGLGKIVDFVLMGHYHTDKLKTYQNSVVIVNGSVVATNDYAMSKRLFSKPEQTLLIFDHNNLIKISINL